MRRGSWACLPCGERFSQDRHIEAYTPTDNVSELTARVNDDGWETSYVNWLKGSRLSSRGLLLVFSVGGGNREHKISMNLVRCLELAQEVQAAICRVVGRDGGYAAQVANACVIVPTVNPSTVQTSYQKNWGCLHTNRITQIFLKTRSNRLE